MCRKFKNLHSLKTRLQNIVAIDFLYMEMINAEQ